MYYKLAYKAIKFNNFLQIFTKSTPLLKFNFIINELIIEIT